MISVNEFKEYSYTMVLQELIEGAERVLKLGKQLSVSCPSASAEPNSLDQGNDRCLPLFIIWQKLRSV